MRSIRAKVKNISKPISSKSRLAAMVEKRHIQAHLALTELRLRIHKAPGHEAQINRSRALDILHDYWRRGIFPKNTYRPLDRRPIFIDETGVYCAVGYLMAETGYRDLALQINQRDQFVLVEQLDSPKAELWLEKNGISREEAALVQPGYGGFIIERVDYSLQDRIYGIVTLIACMALLSLAFIALRLLRNKALLRPQKRKRYALVAMTSIAIIAGFALFLPTPKRAVEALTSGSVAKETIMCGGWNTPENAKPNVCKEFEENGGAPGWRYVPCEGLCLL